MNFEVNTKIKFETKLLEQLLKNLNGKKKIKIGIFGDSGLATVAKKMEFGHSDSYIPQLDMTVDVPARSFLEVPIAENLKDEVRIDDKKDLIEQGIDLIAENIKKEALNIVENSFHNEGYGKWEANLPEWKDYKEQHGYDTKILGYTDKLRESIEGKIE